MQAALALFLLFFLTTPDSRPIAIGQTLEGRLGDSSQQTDAVAAEDWEIIGRSGQTVTIEATSNEFDPVLKIFGSDGKLIAEDDNGGLGLNARIVTRLPADGRYKIVTSAIWQKRKGNYRLSVVEGETPVKTGKEKFAADLEYLDLCLRVTKNPAWKSEINSGRLLPLLGLRKDDEALSTAEEAVALAREADDKFALSKAFFTIATGFALYDEYKRAIPYFEEALKIRQEIKDRPGEGAVLSAMGSAYQQMDDYEKATELFKQSLALHRELKDRAEERFALYGIAEALRFLKQPQQAISYYEQVLSLERQPDTRYNDGFVLMGMANCYRSLDQYDRATPLYERALKIGKELKDRTLEAISLAALGDSYRYLGDCGKATPYYEQTLAIRRELKDRRGEAYTLNGLAECARSQGKTDAAITHLQQMLAICRENGDKRGESIALNGLGGVYRSTSQPQQAITSYEQALMVVREIKDRRGEYLALIGIAAAHRALAQHERALPYLEQALAMNTQNSETGNIEPVLVSLAGISFSLGQFEKAAAYSERALSIKHEGKERTGEAEMFLLLALSQRALAHADQAMTAYRQALALFQELKNIAGEYSTNNGIGELSIQKNDWPAAQASWDAALKTIEMNPGVLPTQDTLPGFVAPFIVFQNYIDALASREQYAQAVVVAERSRVHSYRVAIWSASQSAKAVDDGMKWFLPLPSGVEQMQQVAQRLGATIIEYIPTQRGLVSCVIKPEGAVVGHYEMIGPEKLNAILSERRARYESKNQRSEKLRQALGEPSSEPQTPNGTTSQEVSPQPETDLYKLLFAQPIEEALPADTGARLLIIASGKLGTISFADLQDGQGRALIDRFTLLSGPSVSTYMALARRRASEEEIPRTGGLVLAGPNSPTYDGKTLPMLDEIKDESKEVADTLKTKPLTGAAATETILREQGTGKQVIHLATYGFTNEKNPLSSFIALSPELNEQGEILQNGLLTADKLRGLSLNTDLLVISGFQAGFNPTGEGYSALINSLAQTGCSSLLLTLWSVDPKPAAMFMKTFYQKLKKSNDIADSFRQAMLKTREKYKDPAQWAGFVLIGKN